MTEGNKYHISFSDNANRMIVVSKLTNEEIAILFKYVVDKINRGFVTGIEELVRKAMDR